MHILMCKYAVLFSILFPPQHASKTAELSAPAQVSTGCHGNTHGDFLIPACANQTIIAVSGVYAMVKKTDTGCPEAATETDRDEEKCCTYSTRDCKLLYKASEMSFYEDCTGVYTCKMKVATQLTQGCNDVGYLLRSNYMMMEYFCIPRSMTLEGVEDASVSASAVYLKSKGYPAGIPAGTEVKCSIAASCHTPVIITTIHVDLHNDSSGTCQQRLNIKDNNEEKQIDCDSNNGDTFTITEAFKSKSHFLVISFLNNNSGNTGRYWLEIKADASGATVEMTCGNDAASTSPSADKCTEDPDHSKGPVDVTEDPVMSESISDGYKKATIGLGTGLAVCLLVLIGVLTLKRCNKVKVQPADQATGRPTSNSVDGSGDPQGQYSLSPEQCVGGNGRGPVASELPPIEQKSHTAKLRNTDEFNEDYSKVLSS
ncbi:uncharacterized protein [Haliotis asinina]|uniref:uncharacterized protein n=1 Tax=Haliotis asinina TaxID=109174 RepID=UPI003531CBE6